ncbi:hypothetical protein [Sediminibacterium soli]|uniref:hypothetical protein n=1 Tax=Sediminibacterium soli TaxID=2698829 RepID=UPI001F38B86A|nr:hypothetical protein [Sediminibacterium soli]
MIQQSGASQEMELPFFLGCAEDGLFTAALADGFVSAMTQLIFWFKKLQLVVKKNSPQFY